MLKTVFYVWPVLGMLMFGFGVAPIEMASWLRGIMIGTGSGIVGGVLGALWWNT